MDNIKCLLNALGGRDCGPRDGAGGRQKRLAPARGQCAPALVRHSTSARQRNHTTLLLTTII